MYEAASRNALVDCVQAAYLLQSLKRLHSVWKPFFYTFTSWSLSAVLFNYEIFEVLGGKKQANKKPQHNITVPGDTKLFQSISLPSFGKYVTHIKILCKAFTIIIWQKQASIPQTNAFLPSENPYTNTVLLHTVSRQQWSISALLSTISLNYLELKKKPQPNHTNYSFLCDNIYLVLAILHLSSKCMQV